MRFIILNIIVFYVIVFLEVNIGVCSYRNGGRYLSQFSGIVQRLKHIKPRYVKRCSDCNSVDDYENEKTQERYFENEEDDEKIKKSPANDYVKHKDVRLLLEDLLEQLDTLEATLTKRKTNENVKQATSTENTRSTVDSTKSKATSSETTRSTADSTKSSTGSTKSTSKSSNDSIKASTKSSIDSMKSTTKSSSDSTRFSTDSKKNTTASITTNKSNTTSSGFPRTTSVTTETLYVSKKPTVKVEALAIQVKPFLRDRSRKSTSVEGGGKTVTKPGVTASRTVTESLPSSESISSARPKTESNTGSTIPEVITESSVPQKTTKVKRWGEWTEWSACTVTCGKGRSVRWRHCLQLCDEAETEMEEKTCELPECKHA